MLNQINSTTWTADLGDPDLRASNVIGGSDPGSFVPNINAGKWDDECWFNLNLPITVGAGDVLAVTSEAHWFHGTQERVEWTHGDMKMFAYDLGVEVLETGVEYASQPADNVIALDLQHSGLSFTYQPTLAEDDTGPGMPGTRECIPRVEGSWAVYHNKKHFQYRTGKFAHALRWACMDSNQQTAWTTMVVEHTNGVAVRLLIFLDADFMASATYPVVVMGAGDTLGYTSEPTNVLAHNDGNQDGFGPFTVGTNGDATQVVIWTNASAGNADVCGGIWSWSGGEPVTLLRDTANQVVTNTAKHQVTIALDSDLAVTTGTNYGVGWASNANPSSFRFYYDSAQGHDLYRENTSYSGGGTLSNFSSPTSIGEYSPGVYFDTTDTGGGPSYTPRMGLLGVG